MRRITLTAAAAALALASLTAAAPPASADCISDYPLTLSNGDAVRVSVNWVDVTGGRKPTFVTASNMNSGRTYVIVYDEARNGALVHREQHTAAAPGGGWNYNGVIVNPRTYNLDMNVVFKTTSGATLGNRRVPDCN